MIPPMFVLAERFTASEEENDVESSAAGARSGCPLNAINSRAAAAVDRANPQRYWRVFVCGSTKEPGHHALHRAAVRYWTTQPIASSHEPQSRV